jgi:hypothetical protein
MYWPIGAPRIYAASKHELHPKHTTITSDDGLEAQGHVQTPNAETENTNGTATHDQGGDDDDEESVEDEKFNGNAKAASATGSEGKLPAAEALKGDGTSPQSADDDPGGEIVGLKVTRSGHMFATITQGTLTVWQTKVTPTTPVVIYSANPRSSPPP